MKNYISFIVISLLQKIKWKLSEEKDRDQINYTCNNILVLFFIYKQ